MIVRDATPNNWIDPLGLRFYVYIFENAAKERYVGKGTGNRVDTSLGQRIGGRANASKGGTYSVNSPCPSVMTDEDYAYLVEALLIAKIGFRSMPKTDPNIKNENRGRRDGSARRLNKMGKCDRTMIMTSATKDAAIVFGKFESQAPGTGMINY